MRLPPLATWHGRLLSTRGAGKVKAPTAPLQRSCHGVLESRRCCCFASYFTAPRRCLASCVICVETLGFLRDLSLLEEGRPERYQPPQFDNRPGLYTSCLCVCRRVTVVLLPCSLLKEFGKSDCTVVAFLPAKNGDPQASSVRRTSRLDTGETHELRSTLRGHWTVHRHLY